MEAQGHRSTETKENITFVNNGAKIDIQGFTNRLFIRSYQDEDYKACLSLYSDPVITRYFDHGEPRSRSEIDAHIQERGRFFFDKGEPFGLFSVFLRTDNQFIGQADLMPTGNRGEVEIGWILHKTWQNQGYCSEGTQCFLLPLIYKLKEKNYQSGEAVINRVIATAHPENGASQKIIQKLGFSMYKSSVRYGGRPRFWFELPLS